MTPSVILGKSLPQFPCLYNKNHPTLPHRVAVMLSQLLVKAGRDVLTERLWTLKHYSNCSGKEVVPLSPEYQISVSLQLHTDNFTGRGDPNFCQAVILKIHTHTSSYTEIFAARIRTSIYNTHRDTYTELPITHRHISETYPQPAMFLNISVYVSQQTDAV